MPEMFLISPFIMKNDFILTFQKYSTIALSINLVFCFPLVQYRITVAHRTIPGLFFKDADLQQKRDFVFLASYKIAKVKPGSRHVSIHFISSSFYFPKKTAAGSST